MDKDALDTIKKFAANNSNTVTQEEIDFIYRRYCEILFSAIDAWEEKNKKTITPNQVITIRDSHLADEQLHNLYTQANTHINSIYQNIENKVRLDLDGKKTVWKTIGINMVSNFLYTVAVIAIVYFGQDTANQFIDSFRSKPTETIKHSQDAHNSDATNIIDNEYESVDDNNE